jgi:YVTN family beta-propeller protein
MAKSSGRASIVSGPYAFISNSGSASVTVVEWPTKKIVVDRIRVGGNPGAMVLDRAQDFLYVANANPASHSLSVIEIKSGTVVDKIDVGRGVGLCPTSLALSTDGGTVYAALQDPHPSDSIFQVRSAICGIATSGRDKNTVTAEIDMSFGGPPVGNWPSVDGGCGGVGELAIRPGGHLLYAQVSCANKIVVIDTNTNQVVKTFQSGSGPWLSWAPNGQHYYEVNTYNLGGGVTVFNANDKVEESYISPGPGAKTPESLAVTPDSKKLYVACVDSDSLAVIDAKNYSVLATVKVGVAPPPVGITPDGEEVWVMGGGDNQFIVVPTSTNVADDPIPLPDSGATRVVFGTRTY